MIFVFLYLWYVSFWHVFQLLLVYFESCNGHKNNMFSVPTNKCASTEGQPWVESRAPGIKEQGFLLRYLLVYSSVGTKHYLIPPFISTKSHLLCSLPPSMCSAEVFTALIKAFFCGGSKIISLNTFVDLFLNIIH